MIQLEDLRLVDALARAPSLSAAARALNVTPPALSMRLSRLEQRLGLSLAVRSARQLSLTEEGQHLAQQAAELLARMEALPDLLRADPGRLTGSLRVSAPFGFGRRHVAPVLAQFAALHPAVQLHLDLQETPWPDRRNSDLVVHVGSVRDSAWVARTLATNERWLCVSPRYLKARGRPQEPRELLAHACICIRENDEDVTLWHFRRVAGSAGARSQQRAPRESLRITPALTSNDGGVARAWAEQGLGIVLRSQWDVAEAVARGRLVRLLADWDFDSAPITALVPTRTGRSPRVQALLKFLQEAVPASLAKTG